MSAKSSLNAEEHRNQGRSSVVFFRIRANGPLKAESVRVWGCSEMMAVDPSSVDITIRRTKNTVELDFLKTKFHNTFPPDAERLHATISRCRQLEDEH